MKVFITIVALGVASLAAVLPNGAQACQCAAGMGKQTAGNAATEKVELPEECVQCGMDRNMLSHSRMLITYADGTTVGTCSINCVVTEMKANKGKAVKSVEVGDFVTKKLIDAGKAFWVIGGDVRGVMTRIPKWAFAEKEAAGEFIRQHGGKLATYTEALALAETN